MRMSRYTTTIVGEEYFNGSPISVTVKVRDTYTGKEAVGHSMSGPEAATSNALAMLSRTGSERFNGAGSAQ